MPSLPSLLSPSDCISYFPFRILTSTPAIYPTTFLCSPHILSLHFHIPLGKMSPLGVRGRFVINKEVLQLSLSANQNMEMVTIHTHLT